MTIATTESEASLITHDGATALYNYTFQEPLAANVAVYMKPPDPSAEEKLVLGTHFTVLIDSDSVGGSITLVSPTDYPNLSTMRIVRETPPVQASRFANAGSAYPETFEAALDLLTRQVQELTDLVSDAILVPHTRNADFDALGMIVKNSASPVDDNDLAIKSWVESLVVSPPTASAFATARLLENSATLWLDALGLSAYTQGILSPASFALWVDEIGYSTIVENILKDTTAGAIMGELTFSAFFQTLVDAADADAMRVLTNNAHENTVPAANLIVNGDFQVAQNGVSFTAPATATYVADQWVILTENAGAVDVDVQGGSSSHTNSRGRLRVTQATAMDNEKWGLLQIIDNQRSEPLANMKASLSIDIAMTGDLTDFTMIILSWDGTADAPTLDPINAWGGAQVDPTYVTNWTKVAELDIVGSVSFSTRNLENITLPSGCKNIGILLVTNDGGFTATAESHFSRAILTPGSVGREFTPQSYDVELLDCQRFFASTFPAGVAPVENVGDTIGTIVGYSNGAQALSILWRYPVEMLKDPVVVRYNPGNTGTDMEEIEGGADEASQIEFKDKIRAVIASTTVVVSDKHYAIHATADARF